jgi:hypothetical protein
MPSSSGSGSSRRETGQLYSEDEGTAILLNLGYYFTPRHSVTSQKTWIFDSTVLSFFGPSFFDVAVMLEN